MKIGILGPAPPYRGGISLFTQNLAWAITALGHKVVFYNFAQQYPKLLFPGKDQYDNSLDTNEFTNHRLLTPWLPKSWHKTTQQINLDAPDLILVSWFLPFFAPAYGWILRHINTKRKLIIAHNVAAHESWVFAKQLTCYAFIPSDRIVTLSKATLKELQINLPLRITRKGILGFHPIICPKRENDNSRDGHSHNTSSNLLFFGLIKPYKGLDVLLNAMPDVLKAFPETTLTIAGEVYGNEEAYYQQIQQLGISHAVQTHFRYISNAEVASFFKHASLCILPYKTASQSGVIATSYSYGVPILASDVGGLGEYVEHNLTGYLVKPNKPTQLAEAIIKHLKTKPDMRKAILDFSRRFSWQALAELVLNA